MSKKKKESLIPLISTIVVAVLAIIMAVVAIVLLNSDKDNNNDSQGSSVPDAGVTEFVVTDELKGECEFAIRELIKGNSRVVSLFITDGLGYESEPYGNLPEDGLYTVASTEYTTLEQIEDLVRSVFVEEEAQRILTNIDGNGLAVYKNREKLVKIEVTDEGTAESTAESSVQYKTEYVLGISADFAPDTEYSKDWTDLNFGYDIISATECNITVYFGGYNPAVDTAEPLPDQVLELTMVKVGDLWRLKALGY